MFAVSPSLLRRKVLVVEVVEHCNSNRPQMLGIFLPLNHLASPAILLYSQAYQAALVSFIVFSCTSVIVSLL